MADDIFGNPTDKPEPKKRGRPKGSGSKEKYANIEKCIQHVFKVIAKESGGKLSASDTTFIADTIRQLSANKSPEQIKDAQKKITSKAELNRYIRDFINSKSKMVERQLLDRVINAKDPHREIEAILVGTNAYIKVALLSIDAKQNQAFYQSIGSLIADLQKENLHDIFRTGVIESDIVRELFAYKNPGEKPKPATENKEAYRIAQLIEIHKEKMRKRLNEVGGTVEYHPSHMFQQTHDTHRLWKAGEAKFKREVKKLMDVERTLGRDTSKKKLDNFLSSIYSEILTGISYTAGKQNIRGMFKDAPQNILDQTARKRVLIFKDADSFLQYNNMFGKRGLSQSIVAQFRIFARNEAILGTLGPKPAQTLENIVAKAQEHFNARGNNNPKNKEMVLRLERGKELYARWYREVEGSNDIPTNLERARLYGAFRAAQNMAKLGMATLSSVPDVITLFNNLRWHDISELNAFFNPFFSEFYRLPSEERKNLAARLGSGMDLFIGDTYLSGRHGAMDDYMPGQISKAQQLFFKYNLLSQWTDHMKRFSSIMLSQNLGKLAKADRKYAGLSKSLRRQLFRFGIFEEEWEVIKKLFLHEFDPEPGKKQKVPMIMTGKYELFSDMLKGDEGVNPKLQGVIYNYVVNKKFKEATKDSEYTTFETSEGVFKERISKSDVEATEAEMAKAFRDIEVMVNSYFVENADTSVPTSRAKQKAFMYKGTKPGSPEGELLRLLWQFKSFPLAISDKLVGRYAGDIKSGHVELMKIAATIVGSIFAGYIALALKDLADGKGPRPITQDNVGRILISSMLAGGGLGLYGDFLFSDENKYGKTLLNTLAGPGIGAAADFANIARDIVRGEKPENVRLDTVRFLFGNTPFINLFYTRLVLDKMIIWGVEERANPESLERENRRLDSQGRRFFPREPLVRF